MVRDWRLRPFSHHELLGSRTPESNAIEPVWKNYVGLDDAPWLGDHRIGKDIVFPAAGFIAMAGEAVRQLANCDDFSIRNMFLKHPLYLKEADTVELHTGLKPAKLTDTQDSEWYDFTMMSYDGTDWRKHCHGQVRPGCETQPEYSPMSPFPRKVSAATWRRAVGNSGIKFGQSFQRLEETTASHTCAATAIVQETAETHDGLYFLHPTVIDQAFQLMGVAGCCGIARRLDRLAIPMSFDKIYVRKGVGCIELGATSRVSASAMSTGSATAAVEGQVILSVEGATGFTIDKFGSEEDSNVPLLSSLTWNPDIDTVVSKDLQDWRKFFSLLVHSNPRQKVLEIGAGTGVWTAMAQDALRSQDGSPAYSAYTLAASTPDCLRAAKELFEERKNLTFSILDIDKPPADQGYPQETYDLIIAHRVSGSDLLG
jgi:acyl transferase domain-containing protein